MRAILCQELTGYENLVLKEIDPPVAGPNDVLISVKYAALNFFDTLITRGKYQFKPDLPFSPGGEIAGEVLQTGENVTRFKVGDRVMSYVGSGGLREQITAPASKLIPIPEGVTDEVAASISITYGTAMHGLIDRAKLSSQQTIAVLGAGGGAGLAALEIAKAIGAKVVAVASSDEKLERAKKQGADILINSSNSDLKAELKALNEGAGIDVVYDCVGGDLAEPSLRALKWGGYYLVVGFASGEIPKIPLNLIMLKGIHVSGVFFGRYIEEQPQDFNNDMTQLLNWCNQGIVKPFIAESYPLEETILALSRLANRQATGKIVIEVA